MDAIERELGSKELLPSIAISRIQSLASQITQFEQEKKISHASALTNPEIKGIVDRMGKAIGHILFTSSASPTSSEEGDPIFEIKKKLLKLTEALESKNLTEASSLIETLPKEIRDELDEKLLQALGLPEESNLQQEISLLDEKDPSDSCDKRLEALHLFLEEQLSSIANKLGPWQARLEQLETVFLNEYQNRDLPENALQDAVKNISELFQEILLEEKSLSKQIGSLVDVKTTDKINELKSRIFLIFSLSSGDDSRQYQIFDLVNLGQEGSDCKKLTTLPQRDQERICTHLSHLLNYRENLIERGKDAFLDPDENRASSEQKKEAVLKFIAESPASSFLSTDGASQLLQASSNFGHKDSVLFLLKSHPVTDETLKESVALAAKEARVDVLHILLEGRTLNQDTLDWAVDQAAEGGSTEALAILLEKGEISTKSIERIVPNAAEYGGAETLGILLQRYPINQDTLERAVISAAKRGNVKGLEMLLKKGDISQNTLESAVAEAAGAGSVEALAILLEGRKVSQQALIKAINLSVLNQMVNTVDYLLSLDASLLSDKAVLNIAIPLILSKGDTDQINKIPLDIRQSFSRPSQAPSVPDGKTYTPSFADHPWGASFYPWILPSASTLPTDVWKTMPYVGSSVPALGIDIPPSAPLASEDTPEGSLFEDITWLINSSPPLLPSASPFPEGLIEPIGFIDEPLGMGEDLPRPPSAPILSMDSFDPFFFAEEPLESEAASHAAVSTAAASPPLANFRSLNVVLDNHNITIAGMRHPSNQGRISLENACKILKYQGFTQMISLDSRNSEIVERAWVDPSHARNLYEIEDFRTPTNEQMLEICKIAKETARKDHKLLIHCGEGWGRSGMILSGLKLLSILQNKSSDDPYWRQEPLKNASVNLERHEYNNYVITTSIVAEAIHTIRSVDQLTTNAESTEGSSVEKEEQVKFLENFELFLKKCHAEPDLYKGKLGDNYPL